MGKGQESKKKPYNVKQRSKYCKKRPKVFCKKSHKNLSTDDNIEQPLIEEGERNNESLLSNSSIASEKVETISFQSPRKQSKVSGFRLLDMEILAEVISSFSCPSCNQPINLKEDFSNKRGLASMLIVSCEMCSYEKKIFTSRTCTDKGYFEVNHRMVYAMRACGQGHRGIETFTSLMNMPKPMTRNNYDKMNIYIKTAAKKVAEDTMNDALLELKQKRGVNPTDIIDISASLDGSWQRRVFSSLNGNVAAISMEIGKVIDTEPMSKTCKACKQKEQLQKTDPDAYEAWKANHSCSINYQGSALVWR